MMSPSFCSYICPFYGSFIAAAVVFGVAVLGSEAASSPIIGNTVTAVIDNPCESFATFSVSKVHTDRKPFVFLVFVV